MITQAELLKKALRPWSTGAFLQSRLRGESLFPLTIRFTAPSGKKLSRDFAKVRTWMATLKKNSKLKSGRQNRNRRK